MEDGPLFKLRLSEHFALDLSIDFTRTLFDIKAVWSTTSIWTHQETTGIVLEALKFLRVLIELQVPKLLLLNAFFVCLEVLHQVFDLLDFCISVSVNDLCKVLHQTEVGTHSVSQASQLTKFRNKSNFIACSSVLVDEEGLVRVGNVLVVAGLVVVSVAGLSAVLVETGLWTLVEVNAIDLVRLLVVLGDHSCSSQSLLDGFVTILATPFSILPNFVHVLEHCVGSHDFEAHVYVKQSARLLHDESRIETRPNPNVVSIKVVRVRLVEGLLTDGLKPKTAHHRVKEDLQEIHVIPIMLLHDLDPLDVDGILDTI